jgi:hypothetical protein
MSQESNTDFLKELFVISESFANAVIHTSSDNSKFENDIIDVLNNATPEEQSNLLFLCGMLIVQLSNVDVVEKRSAVATSMVFKKALDAHLNNVANGGSFIKALTFPLVYPRLDKDTKSTISTADTCC